MDDRPLSEGAFQTNERNLSSVVLVLAPPKGGRGRERDLGRERQTASRDREDHAMCE